MRVMSKAAWVPPRSAGVDSESTARIEGKRAELIALAAELGLDARRLNTEPYERAAGLERTEGPSLLSRSLHQIANANAAIYRAGTAAQEGRDARNGVRERLPCLCA
jgi:hypothetical protein